MFGFGKKKPEVNLVDSKDLLEKKVEEPSSDVYVMPEKYILKGGKGGGSNKGLIFLAIILIIVIIITATYLIYDVMMINQEKNNSNKIVSPKIELIENDDLIGLIVEENDEEVNDLEEDIDLEEDEDVEEDNDNNSGLLADRPSISLDSDGDGLTDVEETIFGTSLTNIDSDSDGYSDWSEIYNGFNPTSPGGSKLIENPFITSITTDFDNNNFKLFYPKEWQVSLVKNNEQLLITASTGEIFRISVRINQPKLPAMSLYLQDNPQVPVSELKMIDTLNNDLSGIYSPDGLMAYLTDNQREKIYVFEYVVGRQTEIRYPSIFAMFIRTFSKIEDTNTNLSNGNNNLVAIIKNVAKESLKNDCSNGLNFCQINSCGIMADGVDSCLENLSGYCYEKECVSDSDCIDDKKCNNINCYLGSDPVEVKLCS